MFVTLQCDRYRRHKLIQSTPLECVTASIGVALLRMIGIIYKYTSPSGKVYIGQTTQEKRRRKTFLNLNKSYGGVKINNARHRYSPEAFTYEVLCRIKFATAKEAQEKLDELEEYYIKEFDTYRNGYNMTFGGYTTTGMKLSEKTRLKLSRIRKGKKKPPLSEEQKKAHSERMKELYADPEWKAKRLLVDRSVETRSKRGEKVKGEKNGMFGKVHTLAARKKMSASRKGEKNHNYGKTFSDEHKRKCRESALKRTPMLEETKIKIKFASGVAVCQYSISGEFIAEYPTAKIAAQAIGKESSCILKCCKDQRAMAYGFKWKYKDAPLLELNNLDRNTWISISEAIELSGHKSVVLYYHMDVIKDIPYKQHGKRRYLHKPSILSIFVCAV